MTKRRLGFTLIELLIVVAIIAILAAIAVPNFLEAQVRSRVARVKADLRSIALAMEAYSVDWNAYPKSHITPSRAIPAEQHFRWFSALTSPVAYLSSMPRDPFQTSRAVWGDTYEMFGTYWLNIWYKTVLLNKLYKRCMLWYVGVHEQ